MPLRKLRDFGDGTKGVTLPKGDLEVLELLEEDGSVREDEYVHVRRTDRGGWEIRVDPLED